MADNHKHGEMKIHEQEKTFDGFIKATAYSVVAIFVVLVVIAILGA